MRSTGVCRKYEAGAVLVQQMCYNIRMGVINMTDSSKLKLLYILEIMKKTDELHPFNTTEIAAKLTHYGITAERKSISRDLRFLEYAGYSIMLCEDHNRGYYMTDQLFEDYELKILSDAVNAAPFLTDRDSRELAKKVRSLATIEGEELIAATSFSDSSIKTEDKQNKTKLDQLIRAIKAKKKVSFQYYVIGRGNKRSFLRDGYIYTVSPYYLVLSQGEYYLIANPDTHDHLTHFKIELIANICVKDESLRHPKEIAEHGKSFDITAYVKRSLNMWSGEAVDIRLRCHDSVRNHIRMRFGSDIWVSDEANGQFTISVNVADSPGLYQWLAQYGAAVRILSPQNVIEQYLKYLYSIQAQYDTIE